MAQASDQPAPPVPQVLPETPARETAPKGLEFRDGDNVVTFSGAATQPAQEPGLFSKTGQSDKGTWYNDLKNVSGALGREGQGGVSGAYSMDARFASGLHLTGQAQAAPAGEATPGGLRLGNMNFRAEQEDRNSCLTLGGEYILNQAETEVRAVLQRLLWDDRLAGVLDATYSGRLFQGAGSLGYTLQDDRGQGLGVVRFTYAYLEKELRQHFAQSGLQVQRMPQHSLGLQYENYSEFDWFGPVFQNEWKVVYAYHLVDMTRQYVAREVETDTADLWKREEAWVGFGGGTRQDLKLLDSWGNDRFRLTAGIGLENTKFDSMSKVDLGVKDRVDPAFDLGVKVNLMPWLQVGGDAKYSELQGQYKASLSGDTGKGLISLNAERVENKYRDAEERYGLRFELAVYDLAALMRGVCRADGQEISQGLGGGRPGDNLKLFRHKENPAAFTNAKADAVHAEGLADKTLKAARAEEKLRLSISIDKTGLPGGVTASGSLLTISSTAVLTSVASVTPASETAAFSISGGKLVIDTSKLSQATQTIWVTVNEAGGTTTVVKVSTVKGSTKVTGVDFLSGLTAQQAADIVAGTTTMAALRATPTNPAGAPVMDAADDTGSSSTDAYTSVTNPHVTVPALTNSVTYKISVDGGAWSAAQASRTFSLGVLAQGAHTVKYRGISAAGVETSDSPTLTLTIDTTALSGATVDSNQLTENVQKTIRVTVAGGNIWQVTGITVTGGTGSATLAAAPDGSHTYVDFLVTATNAPGLGNFSFDATLKDQAGNSYITGFSFDTNAALPDTPSAGPSMNAASDTGGSSTDAYTSNTSPDFTGTALGNSAGGYQFQVDGGAWSATQAGLTYNTGVLAEGAHTIKYRGVNGSGVTGAASPAKSFTIDTTSLSGATAGSNEIYRNSGNTVTVTVSGGNIHQVMNISVTSGTGTVTLLAAPAGASSSVQFLVTPSNAAGAGAFSFSANYIDQAGNNYTQTLTFDIVEIPA